MPTLTITNDQIDAVIAAIYVLLRETTIEGALDRCRIVAILGAAAWQVIDAPPHTV